MIGATFLPDAQSGPSCYWHVVYGIWVGRQLGGGLKFAAHLGAIQSGQEKGSGLEQVAGAGYGLEVLGVGGVLF